MKNRSLLTLIIFFCIHNALNAQAWDERPSYSLNVKYEKDSTTKKWDQVTFYGFWDSKDESVFTSEDIDSGYLQFVFPQKRILRSKLVYPAPYSFECEINH